MAARDVPLSSSVDQGDQCGNCVQYMPVQSTFTNVSLQVVLFVVLIILLLVNVLLQYKKEDWFMAVWWLALTAVWSVVGPITIANLPKLLVHDFNSQSYILTTVGYTFAVPFHAVTTVEAIDGCIGAAICTVKGALTEQAGCFHLKGIRIHTNMGKSILFSPMCGGQRFLDEHVQATGTRV